MTGLKVHYKHPVFPNLVYCITMNLSNPKCLSTINVSEVTCKRCLRKLKNTPGGK